MTKTADADLKSVAPAIWAAHHRGSAWGLSRTKPFCRWVQPRARRVSPRPGIPYARLVRIGRSQEIMSLSAGLEKVTAQVPAAMKRGHWRGGMGGVSKTQKRLSLVERSGDRNEEPSKTYE